MKYTLCFVKHAYPKESFIIEIQYKNTKKYSICTVKTAETI